MKKILAVIMTLLALTGLLGLTMSVSADDAATVYVSVSDDKGELVLTQSEVYVTDTDEDGVLTIKDALYETHEIYYDGGAEAGFASSVGSYGIQLDKLWGVANGGSYGYYVNNASAMGLGDEIKDGDYIKAFVYTDLSTWSDTYCFFDVNTVKAAQGEDVELVLLAAGYDANWSPITYPVADATIMVNGVATEYKTDADGKVTLKIEDTGYCVVSAKSETQTLVPPVCVATVSSSATADVKVTISDDKGELVLIQKDVTVSDIDKDGELTINDALYIAHEENFEGGAAAGYGSGETAYGLSLNKLWGVANGGSYGYYVNNGSAWSLADIVNDGDYINAFVYTDLSTWSDTYCYFDYMAMDIKETDEVKLQLLSAGYDAEWNPIAVPVADAVITINGEATEYKTDAEGYVSFSLEAGEYVISAKSETQILVPAACKISVADVEDKTADNNTDKDADKNTGNSTNNSSSVNNSTNSSTSSNTTSAASGKTTAPKTADTNMFALYVVVMLAAASVIIALNNKKAYEK